MITALQQLLQRGDSAMQPLLLQQPAIPLRLKGLVHFGQRMGLAIDYHLQFALAGRGRTGQTHVGGGMLIKMWHWQWQWMLW